MSDEQDYRDYLDYNDYQAYQQHGLSKPNEFGEWNPSTHETVSKAIMGPFGAAMGWLGGKAGDVAAKVEEAMGGAPAPTPGSALQRSGERVQATAETLGAPPVVAGAAGFAGETLLNPALYTGMGLVPPRSRTVAPGSIIPPEPPPGTGKPPIVPPEGSQVARKATRTAGPKATFYAMQEIPESLWPQFGKQMALYNLEVDIPGHPKGSTVSAKTLREAGIEPPPEPPSGPPSESGLTAPRPGVPWPSTVTPPEPSVLDLARRHQQGITEATLRKAAQTPAVEAGLPIPRQFPEAENVKLETFRPEPPTRPGGTKFLRGAEWSGTSGEVPVPLAPAAGAPSPALPKTPGPNAAPPGPALQAAPGSPMLQRMRQGWARDWERFTGYWRWDRAMIDAVPNTPVLTNIEALRAAPQMEMSFIIANPTYQAYKAMPVSQIIALEDMAVKAPKLAPMDPRLAAVNASVDASTRAVNEMRVRRGLDPIHMIAENYLPRMTTAAWKNEHLIGQWFGMGGRGLSTTARSFGEKRIYRTMLDGKNAGVEYRHPVEAALWHEAFNRMALATDRIITNLEEAGVLNRTPAEALTKSPTGKMLNVKGLPFEPTGGWWVRSVEEGRFLQQNLRPTPGGTFTHFFHQVVRNPGLVIPNKHILNMLDKFGVSGGDWIKLAPYWVEWERMSNIPAWARFNELVPMTEATSTAAQQITRATPIDWTRPSSVGTKMLDTISQVNSPSAYVIFNRTDPALRYARWRQYVEGGMDEQTAANHVMLDLVRYGARSARLDYLKSIPLNFYAAWRTGSLSTVVKAAKYATIPALMYVGVWDMLREIDYRRNGYTHHRFWDYVERPLAALADAAQTIHKGKPQAYRQAWDELASTMGGTVLFGPGGDITVRNMEAIFRDLQGKVDPAEAARMFLVLNTIASVKPEWDSYQRTGDVKYLHNAILGVLMNRRVALIMEPHRAFKFLPEVRGTPLAKSPTVRVAEIIQQAIKDIRYGRMDVSQYAKDAAKANMSPEDYAIFSLTRQLTAVGLRPVQTR